VENEGSTCETSVSGAEIISRAVAGTLDLMTFASPTFDPKEKQIRSRAIWEEIRRIFLARLSPAETDLALREHNADPSPDLPEETELFDKFDEIVIQQAAALGWRMYECEMVIERIAVWMDSGEQGIKKLERFSAAAIRFAEVRQGRARAPFTEPEWHLTRRDAFREIKNLQARLYAQCAVRNRPPHTSEVYSAIRAEIDATPQAYPYLASNLTSFLDYLRKRDCPSQSVCPLSVAFVMRQETPATVLDGWFDYQGNTAAGKSRQIISLARSRQP